MHSCIFQVGTKPISEDNFYKPEYLYENSSDFADYIGDEYTEEKRADCIKDLAKELEEIFTLDEKELFFTKKDKASFDKFLEKWAKAIKDSAAKIDKSSVLRGTSRYKVESACNETHLMSSFRFVIEDYNGGYAAPMSELIEYVSDMRKGRKIYIGAVIDYHF